ncbi:MULTISPECIES: C2H2-type zinc finger protein [unclassified Methanoculleus]|uniref:C2H2-type zinc finger protein n=1 Tax=unclassified Methanoculleus TaxID=2619537 RepID=UPI0025FD59D2|nr:MULTISPECIES: C2H2-type zinc finger protein [unclassified Methanoculleus]MCK9318928.1 C2H2-type zinc finger protein [Methanoculleus sp.]MDD2254903.1 C2H2-type zinc finger protein [Methanoculleus sp.]MDD2786678.1 C2H2-type zinc finger protein [Methanoculleus sp.]MDD3215482.1 C2H2-type zinc finger protein [Methanoculleus sp.]MDD4313244.1 C2H2-type zinc finger protein [Methanoculleus sp.]
MTGEPLPRGRVPDIPVEMGEFTCPICGRQYPTLEDLHAHVQRAHRHPPEIR